MRHDVCIQRINPITAPQHLVCRVVQSLHTNHMQMCIIEVSICRRQHMDTSMIPICIWLVCRLCTTLHTKCCSTVMGTQGMHKRTLLWRQDVCTQNQFTGTSCMHIQKANPMGTQCISKNQSYEDGMYIHRTNTIWEHSVCTKDQSYGNMMHVNAKDQCKMHVQRSDPIWEHNACAKGPILCGHVQVQRTNLDVARCM